jgi:GT2 family glycosyltransferase/O-antigen ligase
MPVLSILIINFQASNLVIDCAAKLTKYISPKLIAQSELIILNNSPEQKSELAKIDRFKSHFSKLNITNNDKNIGFANAMNQGAKLAKGQFLLFLNFDIDFAWDFISPLIKFTSTHKKIGLVSPRLILPSGAPQLFSHGKKPSIFNLLKSKSSLNIMEMQKKTESHDWVAGTCLLINKKKFLKLNGFDNHFFMYFEDVDLCLRAKASGLKNYILNYDKLVHFGGNKKTADKKSYRLSADYFIQKNYNYLYFLLFKICRYIFNFGKKSYSRIINPSANIQFIKIAILLILMFFLVLISWSLNNINPEYIFLGLLFITFIVLSFIFTRFVWLAIIFLLPFQFSITESHYTPYVRIMIPLFMACWLIKSLWQRRLKFFVNSTPIFYILLISLTGISLIAVQKTDGLGKFIFLLTIMPFYFVSSSLISKCKNKTSLKKIIVKLILASGLIVNLIGLIFFLLQFHLGIDGIVNFFLNTAAPILWGEKLATDLVTNNSWLVSFHGSVIMRGISIFSSPHQYSFFLAIIIPLSICYTCYYFFCAQKHNIFIIFLLIANILLDLMTLAFTFSRGAYLSFFLASLICFPFFLKTISSKAKTLVLSVLVSLIVFSGIILSPLIGERISNLLNSNEPSNQDRINILTKSLDIVKENWPFGIGYGRFDAEAKPKGFDYNVIINAHNTYLELAVELGFLGPLILLIFFIKPITDFFYASKKNQINWNSLDTWLWLAVVYSIIWLGCNAFFEVLLYSPVAIPLLMVILALIPYSKVSTRSINKNTNYCLQNSNSVIKKNQKYI